MVEVAELLVELGLRLSQLEVLVPLDFALQKQVVCDGLQLLHVEVPLLELKVVEFILGFTLGKGINKPM